MLVRTHASVRMPKKTDRRYRRRARERERDSDSDRDRDKETKGRRTSQLENFAPSIPAARPSASKWRRLSVKCA
eukprot:2659971-Pleurochrysis_carterae.AAC.1